ncbi:MAG: thiamine-phosphate kinase [Epsilonproteobacteria bacterium]|nr:thiamine-phosphate kinase [Campylobacterota bacterium]
MNREDYLINKLSSSYIGDDGAIVGDKIYSMDAFFEGVHFKREWMSLTQIARKAMLVNISDAIAMSAKPIYALVTLSLPKDITKKDIDEILSSLYNTANEFGCEIIGGDTIAGERLDFTITIISHSDNPLTRKGLKEGDLLGYTGILGESKRDLNRLLDGKKVSPNSRFIEPILRDKFIELSRPYLSVGMDISDGLYCDTNKLLDYNRVGFEPLIDIDDSIGSSGEEYEMLIGFQSDKLDTILEIAKEIDLELTIFAKVQNNSRRFNCINHHN